MPEFNAANKTGQGKEVCPPGQTPLRPSGSGGYFCEDCYARRPHKFCRPSRNLSEQKLRGTQWELPPMGHGFPRQDMDVTPQEVLYDHDKILGGPEHTYQISPPGPTVLQQPRVETSLYKETQTVDLSPYRILDPLLEKFQHIYPRFDSETVFASNLVEAPPGAVPTTALTFDTVPGVNTYLRNIQITVMDGLLPVNIGAGCFVDGNPVKVVAQPTAATSPPTYGVQPQTPNFPILSGMPTGIMNCLLIIPDRKRVEIRVVNTDPIATRLVCVHFWGWMTSFVNFGR